MGGFILIPPMEFSNVQPGEQQLTLQLPVVCQKDACRTSSSALTALSDLPCRLTRLGGLKEERALRWWVEHPLRANSGCASSG